MYIKHIFINEEPAQLVCSSDPSSQSFIPLQIKAGEIHLFSSQENIFVEQVAPKL